MQRLGWQLRRPKQVSHGAGGCSGRAGGDSGGLGRPRPGAPARGAGTAREELGVALLLALAQQQRWRPGATAPTRCRRRRRCCLHGTSKGARRSPVPSWGAAASATATGSSASAAAAAAAATPTPRSCRAAASSRRAPAPPPGLNVVPQLRGTWRQARSGPITA